jgi:hypothetical protein
MSEEVIVCTAPSLKPRNYAIQVSMNGVDVMDSSLYFRSDHELDVLMAIPPIGIHSGTNITVVGKSFVPSDYLTCSFGEYGVACFVYWIDRSQLPKP